MTTTVLLEEIRPGAVLLERFMKAMGVTARRLAADIHAPQGHEAHHSNGWLTDSYLRRQSL